MADCPIVLALILLDTVEMLSGMPWFKSYLGCDTENCMSTCTLYFVTQHVELGRLVPVNKEIGAITSPDPSNHAS